MLRRKFVTELVPNYGLQEAVRWLHVPNATLYHWLKGTKPLVNLADHKRRLLSFKNLIEFYVLEGLRISHGVKLPEIREAVDYLEGLGETSHPLADYELKTDGRFIFFWHRGEYLNVSMRGQRGLGPILDSYLRRIERNPFGRATVLHPFMRLDDMRSKDEPAKVVSINPNVCFGMPVLRGSRITTSALASRYLGGDMVPVIARSYGRSEAEIESAIKWEIGKTTKTAA